MVSWINVIANSVECMSRSTFGQPREARQPQGFWERTSQRTAWFRWGKDHLSWKWKIQLSAKPHPTNHYYFFLLHFVFLTSSCKELILYTIVTRACWEKVVINHRFIRKSNANQGWTRLLFLHTYTGWPPKKPEQSIQSIFRTLLWTTVIFFHLTGYSIFSSL